jgi:hypothetical protein
MEVDCRNFVSKSRREFTRQPIFATNLLFAIQEAYARRVFVSFQN